MRLFALSISCVLVILTFTAAPAQACFVCDNQQCRELDKHSESEIGFPNCIDGVDENGPFCHVSGFPCITPPGGFTAVSAVDAPAMSTVSTECSAPDLAAELPLATDDLARPEAAAAR